MDTPPPGKTVVGKLPLAAFFVGAAAVALAGAWNAHAHYDGGWESFSRAGVSLLIMLAALPYAVAFGVGALVQCLRYRNAPSVSRWPAMLALLLHGICAGALVSIFVSL